MATPLDKKSTTEQIRARFDADVQRFSNLESGQSSTIDAALAMDLITSAAISSTPEIRCVLDLGCGAGNNTLKLRAALDHDFEIDLVDLSQPMLDRAQERIAAVNSGRINIHQGDFREIDLGEEQYDVVLAAAVLHHLRDDDDWLRAFEKIYKLLRSGGSIWITDLVSHDTSAIQQMMWERYGQYLESLGGDEYRDKVFTYIDAEDSPRSVTFQIELLRKVGFSKVEILHKNSCFAAFGAIKI